MYSIGKKFKLLMAFIAGGIFSAFLIFFFYGKLQLSSKRLTNNNNNTLFPKICKFYQPIQIAPTNDILIVRSMPELIIGIPSTFRKTNYLLNTLRDLFSKLAMEEYSLVKFIVMIAEANINQTHIKNFIDETIDILKINYSHLFTQGLVDIIAINPAWYPNDLHDIPSTFNDSKQRMEWRTKQNLDYAYLMNYVYNIYPYSKYYLQLEDDIITLPNFVSGILAFVHKQTGKWIMCEFSHLGFIGKLIRHTDLNVFVNFIMLLHREYPIDWILDKIFLVKYCTYISIKGECALKQINKILRRLYYPPLFQHVGYYSSLNGKNQTAKESSFKHSINLQLLKKNNNPIKVKFEYNILSNYSAIYNLYKEQKPITIEFDESKSPYFIDIICTEICKVSRIEILFSYAMSRSVFVAENFVPFNVYVTCDQESAPLSSHEIECKTGQLINTQKSNIFEIERSKFQHDFNNFQFFKQIRLELPQNKLLLYGITIWAIKLI